MSFPLSLIYDDINAISLGQYVQIGAFSEICVFKNSSYSKVAGCLRVEEGVIIGSHANIRAAGGEIFIGQNSLIAQQVSLVASNHMITKGKSYSESPWDEKRTGVYISENVWIGAGVTVLPGCSIGKNSIIGAGSIVTKSVPPNEVWAGTPARKIKDVYGVENKHEEAQYS